MKPLELTKEHKSKLLEMCEILFPEYNDISESGTGPINFHHNNLYPGMLFGFKSNGEDGDSYDHASLFIHWFEFCMTHLAVKLKKLGIQIDYWQMTLSSTHISWGNYDFNHPIDYIYHLYRQKFKKQN